MHSSSSMLSIENASKEPGILFIDALPYRKGRESEQVKFQRLFQAEGRPKAAFNYRFEIGHLITRWWEDMLSADWEEA